MRRPGIAVDAAVLAAAVRVEAVRERDVRAVVGRDDRARPVAEVLGRHRTARRVVRQRVERRAGLLLDVQAIEPVRRLARRAASGRLLRGHRGTLAQWRTKSKIARETPRRWRNMAVSPPSRRADFGAITSAGESVMPVRRATLLACVFLFVFAVRAFAQFETGAVLGTVQGRHSGAVVPGADRHAAERRDRRRRPSASPTPKAATSSSPCARAPTRCRRRSPALRPPSPTTSRSASATASAST